MLKSNKGFTGVEIVLSVIIVTIFTSIILSLMYNIKTENYKIKSKIITNIYLIETLENIGISSYDDIISENLELFPEGMSEAYSKQLEVTEVYAEDDSKENIIKKIKVTISYKIGNKTYEQSAERLKVNEQF